MPTFEVIEMSPAVSMLVSMSFSEKLSGFCLSSFSELFGFLSQSVSWGMSDFALSCFSLFALSFFCALGLVLALHSSVFFTHLLLYALSFLFVLTHLFGTHLLWLLIIVTIWIWIGHSNLVLDLAVSNWILVWLTFLVHLWGWWSVLSWWLLKTDSCCAFCWLGINKIIQIFF